MVFLKSPGITRRIQEGSIGTRGVKILQTLMPAAPGAEFSFQAHEGLRRNPRSRLEKLSESSPRAARPGPLLTWVCTMCGLWRRRLFTAWNTSSSPSAFTRSRMLLRAMNVPVRPAPALQGESASGRAPPPGEGGQWDSAHPTRGCCSLWGG